MRFIALMLFLLALPALADSEPLLQARLKAHIDFLASDELKGREAGTEGYDIAAAYVASQFRQMGLVPAGSQDSYFQGVPLRRAWLEEGSATFQLKNGSGSREFNYLSEWYRGSSTSFESNELEAEMVFAGYGIEAPPLEYTDFDGIDLEGKIAVTLGGQPLGFPSEEGAHFASGRERLRALESRGAIGMISIYTPRNQGLFQWSRLESSVGKPGMGWLTEEGKVFAAFDQIKGGAFLHFNAAADLFEGADHALESLLEMDETGQNLPVFPLKGTAMLSQRSRHETINSSNVVAMLPGTDPTLSNEYIVYTAHLDHIGVLHGEGHEDAINNGAMDNASGISVMLETARLFAEKGGARRSIIFLAVTAEEKGLLGAEYFAQNPTIPEGSMVANINLDMPGLLNDLHTMIAFGAEHSSLGETVRQAAGEFGVALMPDPVPEQNIFVRSDHYRFVQQGVPAVYLVTGPNPEDGPEATARMMQKVKEHYHRVSDESTLPFNYEAAAQFTRINARIGEIVADESNRPTWNEGDFFGDTFSR